MNRKLIHNYLPLSMLMLAVVLLSTSCSLRSPSAGAGHSDHTPDSANTLGMNSASHRLTMPVPPMTLTSDSARMEYVASHYWQSLDLRDTTWIADTTSLEAAFYGWAELLTHLPQHRAAELTGGFIARIAADTTAGQGMLQRMASVSEYYFAHPNSPFRNEKLYIPVLRALIAAPRLGEYEKIRPQYQLERALKNRPGTVAADFSYTTADGSKKRLSALSGEYTLLFFYNPDCHDCARVKEYIAASQVLIPLIASARVKVLAVYTDEDVKLWRERLPLMPQGWEVGYNTELLAEQTYDLRAIPCLYLLGKQKRVILKDAPVEQIEVWFKQNIINKTHE